MLPMIGLLPSPVFTEVASCPSTAKAYRMGVPGTDERPACHAPVRPSGQLAARPGPGVQLVVDVTRGHAGRAVTSKVKSDSAPTARSCGSGMIVVAGGETSTSCSSITVTLSLLVVGDVDPVGDRVHRHRIGLVPAATVVVALVAPSITVTSSLPWLAT